MGRIHCYGMMGLYLIILLIVSVSAAEQVRTGEENTSHLHGYYEDELQNPGFPIKTPELLQSAFSVLQTKILKKGKYSEAVAGAGWQNVSMPVVITSPGMYRIMNDYAAETDMIGVAILASDVYLDGDGHTFSGLMGDESFGVGVSHEDTLSNITITNFSTRECTGGIAFEKVSGMTISDTHHAEVSNGIAGTYAQNLIISNNTITDYSKDDLPEMAIGIVILQGSGIRIEGNRIANLSPDSEESDSYGISLFYTDDVHLIRNEITGPVTVGITSDSGFIYSDNSFDISDNKISDVNLYGIYIDQGHGQVRNNTVGNCQVGMNLKMDETSIINNTIYENWKGGLTFLGENNTISGNILTDNKCNLKIEGETEADFLHHIDRTNLIDGKPFIYIREQDGETIGPADNPAMVLAVQSRNLTIHDLTTGNNMAGIFLINSSDISVSGVHDDGSINGFMATDVKRYSITGSSAQNSTLYGFYIQNGRQLLIDQCHVSGSSRHAFSLFNSEDLLINASYSHVFNPDYREEDASGAYIDYCRNVSILDSIFSESPNSGINVIDSEGILIKKVYLEENGEHGITMMQCTNSSIEESLVLNNGDTGIALDFLSDFTIRRNFVINNSEAGLMFLDVSNGNITDNFFNNTENVMFIWDPTPLVWNTTLIPGDNIVHGSNLGGNFYAAPDGEGFSQTHADRGDGICNASYAINLENVDHLPLAIPPEEMIVNFTADQISGVPPLKVRFSDLSSGYPDSWNWTFGDGNGSSEQNPVHTYTGTGRYTVTLEASGKDGEGILRKNAYIIVHQGRVTGPSGTLMVNSTPQDGSVLLEGIMIGYTPLKIAGIPAGTHQVTITLDGYQSWSQKVTVQQGQITLLPTVRLRRIG